MLPSKEVMSAMATSDGNRTPSPTSATNAEKSGLSAQCKELLNLGEQLIEDANPTAKGGLATSTSPPFATLRHVLSANENSCSSLLPNGQPTGTNASNAQIFSSQNLFGWAGAISEVQLNSVLTHFDIGLFFDDKFVGTLRIATEKAVDFVKILCDKSPVAEILGNEIKWLRPYDKSQVVDDFGNIHLISTLPEDQQP